jgi:type IV fimbrial biogenesis protein FimT
MLIEISPFDRLSGQFCRLSDSLWAGMAPLYIVLINTTKQHGFTVYELLITMLVVGVIITIGIPNFAALTQNSRISATANDLLGSFHLARSEAARSKANVTLCASSNSLTAQAACGGTFDDGWIIFVDLNGDLIRDGEGENILRVYPAIPQSINIVTNGALHISDFRPPAWGAVTSAGKRPYRRRGFAMAAVMSWLRAAVRRPGYW